MGFNGYTTESAPETTAPVTQSQPNPPAVSLEDRIRALETEVLQLRALVQALQ